MAPPRPATADILRDDTGKVTGVLICRADGSTAQTMAIRALEIDAGWTHDDAVVRIMTSRITPGRWYKTPDRNAEDVGTGIGRGWLMIKADARPRAGATPAVHYSWSDDDRHLDHGQPRP